MLFTANSDSPTPGFWSGVHLALVDEDYVPRSSIAHAVFEYGGGAGSIYDGSKGNLTVNALGIPCNRNPCPVLTDIITQKSGSTGIQILENGGFGKGSANITFRANAQYAARVYSNSVGSIPTTSTFVDNIPNAVELFTGDVFTTQTWANLSVPYVLTAPVTELRGSATKLTIAPGTQVSFGKGAAFVVGYDPDETGALIAKGTAAAPIRFGPSVPTGSAYGYWGGLHFWKADGSQLDYVLVTTGGGIGDKTRGVIGDANVTVYREIGPFITNSNFVRSPACAIEVSDGTKAGSNKVTANFFDPALNNTSSTNGLNGQCVY